MTFTEMGDVGGGAGLRKILRPVWDLVDMEGSHAHHYPTRCHWDLLNMGVGGPGCGHAIKGWQPGGC